MFIADLCIPSNFTGGKLSIPEIVDLYGALGFGAIAITDQIADATTLIGKAAVYTHRTLTPGVFPLYLEILRSEAKRAMEKYNLVLIPGVEITRPSLVPHRTTRILGLNIKTYLAASRSTTELARAIRAQGGVAIAGNTSPLWDARTQLQNEFDAWDATTAASAGLVEAVLESGLPKIIGSPATLWKNLFFCNRDVDSILNAIRNQNLSFTLYSEDKINDFHDRTAADHAGAHHADPQSLRHLVVAKTLPSGLVLRNSRSKKRAPAAVGAETAQRH